MKMVDFPLVISFKLLKIPASVSESKEEVASSQKMILGFFMIIRAIDTRCFSPPDSLRPLSPTSVS